MPPVCIVQKRWLLPDTCVPVGPGCPKGSVCTPTAWRPYMIFWKQAAACACIVPAPPAPPRGDDIAPVTPESRTDH
ncbi:MAG TPA: hypothetical protein VMD91_01775 [Candidatus Sulfotelmatobacter sp.]|nr:hypothetical protein [Candidatus Sulfotelmatobacter sp.]